jgi:trehalose-phosphatase
VEYKGLTAAVHYRMAAEADWTRIEQIVYAATARNGALFHVNPGRKVFDIVPRTNWHKGAAVEWINGHLGNREVLTVYLGDDTSDEDAFSVLPDAVTIKVGAPAATCARYGLAGPAAVHEFLLWLAHIVRN